MCVDEALNQGMKRAWYLWFPWQSLSDWKMPESGEGSSWEAYVTPHPEVGRKQLNNSNLARLCGDRFFPLINLPRF